MPTAMAHQQQSLDFSRGAPAVFDMSDCGTGKTFVQIMDWAQGDGRPALVFAPKSLLESAWADDIKKFLPDAKPVACYAHNREEAFDTPADFYITNTDAATWVAGQSKKFLQRFGRLVIDESSSFKHHTSQRSKAMKKIASLIPNRRCLSATPNSRSITDLWHQVLLLDGGQRLGKSFFNFRSSVCDPIQNGPSANMINWVDREYAADAVFALLADITIRHKLEACVDIPQNHTYTVPYHLPAKQLKAYQQMRDSLMLEIKDKSITAVNAAVLVTKLLQVASGAVYGNDGEPTLIDTGRYELVADLVQAREHSVTFFNWEHQRDQLIKEFTKRDIKYAVYDGSTSEKERRHIVKFYQAGFYDTLLAHPQSAGHGLTLTRGTATIWASPTYRSELFEQGLHRIYRKGQTEKTENIVVVAPGTADERAYQRCTDTRDGMKNLLSMFE